MWSLQSSITLRCWPESWERERPPQLHRYRTQLRDGQCFPRDLRHYRTRPNVYGTMNMNRCDRTPRCEPCNTVPMMQLGDTHSFREGQRADASLESSQPDNLQRGQTEAVPDPNVRLQRLNAPTHDRKRHLTSDISAFHQHQWKNQKCRFDSLMSSPVRPCPLLRSALLRSGSYRGGWPNW